MRGYIGVALGILSAGVFAQTIQTGSGGYGASSSFTTAYDASHQVVFSGKVVGKSTFVPTGGMAPAEHILVKNSKGTYEVALGPEWYVKNQVAHVYIGEKVRVIGSSVVLNNARMVLAKQIVNTDNNHVLALRDLSGKPYWVAARETTTEPAAVPDTKAIEGTVQSLQTVMINGVPYQAYMVKNADGTFNVVTAPTWYMNGQDFSVPVGTYIRAVGSNGPINLGNGTIIANSLTSGSSTIILQSAGFPVWNGYNNPVIWP